VLRELFCACTAGNSSRDWTAFICSVLSIAQFLRACVSYRVHFVLSYLDRPPCPVRMKTRMLLPSRIQRRSRTGGTDQVDPNRPLRCTISHLPPAFQFSFYFSLSSSSSEQRARRREVGNRKYYHCQYRPSSPICRSFPLGSLGWTHTLFPSPANQF
jgi:hypothetical protein